MIKAVVVDGREVVFVVCLSFSSFGSLKFFACASACQRERGKRKDVGLYRRLV